VWSGRPRPLPLLLKLVWKVFLNLFRDVVWPCLENCWRVGPGSPASLHSRDVPWVARPRWTVHFRQSDFFHPLSPATI